MDYENSTNKEIADHERRKGWQAAVCSTAILIVAGVEIIRGDIVAAGGLSLTALLPGTIAIDRFQEAQRYSAENNNNQ